MSSPLARDDDPIDRARAATDRELQPVDLTVDIAGTREHRIMNVRGDLTAIGGELLTALVQRLLDDGCRRVRLDLADVRAADLDGVLSVRLVCSLLTHAGATFWITHESHLPLRCTGPRSA